MNNNSGNERSQEEKGQMTVEEAGHKGGQKVKEWVEKGEREEGGSSRKSEDSDEY